MRRCADEIASPSQDPRAGSWPRALGAALLALTAVGAAPAAPADRPLSSIERAYKAPREAGTVPALDEGEARQVGQAAIGRVVPDVNEPPEIHL